MFYMFKIIYTDNVNVKCVVFYFVTVESLCELYTFLILTLDLVNFLI